MSLVVCTRYDCAISREAQSDASDVVVELFVTMQDIEAAVGLHVYELGDSGKQMPGTYFDVIVGRFAKRA